MEKYDYERSIIRDILDYIHDNHITIDWTDTEDDIAEYLIDMLWNEDCITGNSGDGSYYDTEEKCESYLAYNLNLTIEACEEFCVSMEVLLNMYHDKNIARYLDSTIRCYLLNSCIYQAITELKKEEYENFFREPDNE